MRVARTMDKTVPLQHPGAAAVLTLALLLGGCSNLVTYTPKATSEEQSLRFTQGVGTLTVKSDEHELFMHSTFRTQPPIRPTFTIGYANNSPSPVEFSVANVRAFYRGSPVALYTYEERIAEIRSERVGKQVALAILGGLAAVSAAQSASRQTYTTNYSGNVYGRGGYTSFFGSSTTRVYDPAAGILAGAAIGGATALGVRQIGHSAQAEEQAAEAILQANTVDPLKMVSGQVVVKDCCDQVPRAGDKLRFEVTANGKTRVFEFDIRPAAGQ